MNPPSVWVTFGPGPQIPASNVLHRGLQKLSCHKHSAFVIWHRITIRAVLYLETPTDQSLSDEVTQRAKSLPDMSIRCSKFSSRSHTPDKASFVGSVLHVRIYLLLAAEY